MTFLNTADRVADQRTILLAVKERLISQVNVAGDTNVFCALTLQPTVNLSGGALFTVGPTNGVFAQDILDGAGAEDCREETGVRITYFQGEKLDRISAEESLLMDEGRGLLEIKRQILRAFTGHDLTYRTVPLLADLMMPYSSDDPRREGAWGDLSLTFSTHFRWSL